MHGGVEPSSRPTRQQRMKSIPIFSPLKNDFHPGTQYRTGCFIRFGCNSLFPEAICGQHPTVVEFEKAAVRCKIRSPSRK